jgi:hypothetical protein
MGKVYSQSFFCIFDIIRDHQEANTTIDTLNDHIVTNGYSNVFGMCLSHGLIDTSGFAARCVDVSPKVGKNLVA